MLCSILHADLNQKECPSNCPLPIELPQKVITILQKINHHGGRALLTGGIVRDAFLDQKSKDIDIEVFWLEEDEFLSILSEFGKTTKVGKSFGVYKLSLKEEKHLKEENIFIDFTFPRLESKNIGFGHQAFTVQIDPYLPLHKAASRRDFTINSLAYDPLKKIIFDPCGGKKHLKEKVICMTNAKTFSDDPLRIFRMLQLAARLNFTIDDSTLKNAQSIDEKELHALSKERIFEEFNKGLSSKNPDIFFDMLFKTNIIKELYPFFIPHRGNIVQDLRQVKPYLQDLAEKFILSLATISIHLAPNTFLPQFTNNKATYNRIEDIHQAIKRIEVGRWKKEGKILVWLSKINKNNFVIVNIILTTIHKELYRCKTPMNQLVPLLIAPIITGNDLKLEKNFKAGPIFKRILSRLLELQYQGRFKNKEKGLRIARRLYKRYSMFPSKKLNNASEAPVSSLKI